MVISQTQWRSYLLAVVSIGINLSVVYALVVPAVGNRSVANFEFPDRLNFKSGAIADTDSLNEKNIETETELIKARRKYQYVVDEAKIDLELSYLVGTRGDVGVYLQNYTSIDAEAIDDKKEKYLAGVGYHILFSDRHRAYLSSCISPRSLSNVTQRQFSQQRDRHDLRWQNGFDWLRGKASIRDRRCLWVLLSTPIERSNNESVEGVLETAWKEIYHWWLPNFPRLTANDKLIASLY